MNPLDENDTWQRSQSLALTGLALTNSNPRVGCVITSPTGDLLGQGHTQQAGGPHAEVMALRDAQASGKSVKDAIVYVTLEPCSHHGRTPPCCDALIAAGIAKIVVATLDPNPKVGGQGLERLKAAGIEVELLPPDSEPARASRELNIGFFSRMIRGTPWVRMKMAASLDGTSALDNGASQWITGPQARADGHAWRARACAVLSGIGTVLADDPMLDVRELPVQRQPHLVIVDSRLQTPPTARLFNPPAQGLARQIWIYTASDDAARRQALETRGATVIALSGSGSGSEGQRKVDLAAMLRDLARREVNELHLEAGHKLNGSFIREGLVDECLLYLAPRLLGIGQGMAGFGPLASLDDGVQLAYQSVERVGRDLRIVARVAGRDAFLAG
jgi:diaminohydroxyphosphoribosylaminopyrimidine deaminase/5-amino-6-(5-phosphoribosylamino)uracil reductase